VLDVRAQTGTMSLNIQGPYQQARGCVRTCIQDYGRSATFGDLPHALHCDAPFFDSCLCNTASRQTGSAFISTCINALCKSNTIDLSQGFDIWNEYCSWTTGPSVNTATMSIANDTGYLGLKPCAKNCLQNYQPGGTLGDVPYILDCPHPFYDTCLCRADLVSKADSHLTACIMNLCQNEDDVSKATSVYHGYCKLATDIARTASTLATTTKSGGSRRVESLCISFVIIDPCCS